MAKVTRKFKKGMIIGTLVLAQTITMAIPASITSFASSKGFKVSGTKLLDANGNQFVMRGINHAHAWYKGQENTVIPAIAKTGANTVRIAFSDGQRGDLGGYDSIDNVKKLIKLCEDNKLIAVVEVHDTTGSDDASTLDKAADYWISMKSALQGHEDTVILNIGNEWCGAWNSSKWASGYKSVIPKLRNAGIKNTLMIDCAGWGQYPKSIADYGKDVFNSDPDKNTMFSIHMYEYAGANKDMVINNMNGALNQNLAVCIGEFGSRHTDGDVDECAIMDYCNYTGSGYIGWSWKGNGDTWKYLDIANDWSGSSFSGWGNTLLNYSNGIKKTSKTCSVYSGGSVDPSKPETPTGNKVTVEAENGAKNGVNTSSSRSGYSGNGYVTGFDNSNDSVEVTVNVASSGDYYINTQYASEYGDKYTNLSVNGSNRGDKQLKQSSKFTDAYLDTVYLNAGNNKIKLQSSWGYYDIDNITVTKK